MKGPTRADGCPGRLPCPLINWALGLAKKSILGFLACLPIQILPTQTVVIVVCGRIHNVRKHLVIKPLPNFPHGTEYTHFFREDIVLFRVGGPGDHLGQHFCPLVEEALQVVSNSNFLQGLRLVQIPACVIYPILLEQNPQHLAPIYNF